MFFLLTSDLLPPPTCPLCPGVAACVPHPGPAAVDVRLPTHLLPLHLCRGRHGALPVPQRTGRRAHLTIPGQVGLSTHSILLSLSTLSILLSLSTLSILLYLSTLSILLSLSTHYILLSLSAFVKTIDLITSPCIS